VTQAEIEANLESLSQQLSQLDEQRKSRDKIWLLIGILSLFLGVGSAVTGCTIQLFTTASDSSLMIMAPPLIFLSLALFSGMRKPS
jgi:hypothetical protein